MEIVSFIAHMIMFMFPIKSFIKIFYEIPMKHKYFNNVKIKELRAAQHLAYGASGFRDIRDAKNESSNVKYLLDTRLSEMMTKTPH